MNEENENLIEFYSKLPTTQKRKELGTEIAETNFLLESILQTMDPKIKFTPPEEYDNLMDKDLTEDEYLTGLYDDFLTLQENLGIVMDVLAKPYLDLEDKEAGEE